MEVRLFVGIVVLNQSIVVFVNLFRPINAFDASLARTKRVELWLDANIGTSAKSDRGLKWYTVSTNGT